MPTPDSTIVIQRFAESHLEGMRALYNDPAVCRQVLQMPFQSLEVWRKRLADTNERLLRLVAVAWQGQGVGSQLLGAALEVADNWMNLHRVELTVYVDNEPAQALYRKFGFETEGRLRDYAVRDGVLVDALSMARLRQTA